MIDMPPVPPPSPEKVIEQRLIECGLDVSGVSVRYEDYLQSIEIVIRPTAGATADHFECIKNAAGYEIVTFEDREMYRAYSDYTAELARPEMLESLKAGLQERGCSKLCRSALTSKVWTPMRKHSKHMAVLPLDRYCECAATISFFIRLAITRVPPLFSIIIPT